MDISVIMAPEQFPYNGSNVVQWEKFKDGHCQGRESKIVCDHFLAVSEIQHDQHSVFAAMTPVYWPANKNATWNGVLINKTWRQNLKLLTSKYFNFHFYSFLFFSANIKLQLPNRAFSCSFCTTSVVVLKPLHKIPPALHILYVSLNLTHPIQIVKSPLMS